MHVRSRYRKPDVFRKSEFMKLADGVADSVAFSAKRLPHQLWRLRAACVKHWDCGTPQRAQLEATADVNARSSPGGRCPNVGKSARVDRSVASTCVVLDRDTSFSVVAATSAKICPSLVTPVSNTDLSNTTLRMCVLQRRTAQLGMCSAANSATGWTAAARSAAMASASRSELRAVTEQVCCCKRRCQYIRRPGESFRQGRRPWDDCEVLLDQPRIV